MRETTSYIVLAYFVINKSYLKTTVSRLFECDEHGVQGFEGVELQYIGAGGLCCGGRRFTD